MRNRILFFAGLFAAAFVYATAQEQQARVEMANLRQDVMLLSQRVGELAMTVEQLNRDNAALQAKTSESYVTIAQLNAAIADLNRTLQNGLADQKRDVLAQVSTQMTRLGSQTNAALDSLAKSQAARPVVQTSFSENFPKEGINYTVQSGDTLSSIAQKNNSRVTDIRNANKITDDSKIRVGQTLFIPQR
ncbi:LysM peptidoglycan-binding domain-containing protein [Oleiharenicola lentus]|uniref:LysM peptidoglycan-binding domain-containing protein n=1 Tax=Oleiharenicola lentus TaxID=2508720 RepID=UPI003F677088